MGDPVKYCFHVINNGPGDAFDVMVTHPLTGTTISLGDIPAGGEAMDMVSDVIEDGDGQSTATVTGNNSEGDPVPQMQDPAAVAVADPPVVGPPPVAPALEPGIDIRLTVIADDGTGCAGTYAGAIENVGAALPVNVGDPVKYCFHVINTGPGDAFDVTVTHPLTGTTISLGDLPAGSQAMDMVSDVIEAGDGQSTATVNADDSAGDPIPQRDDPAAVAVNAPTSGVLATTPARTPFVPPAPAAAPAPAAPPLAVADTGAMGTTPTNGALPAGAAAPADEVLGVQQAAGATQPTELALTGVYSNLLAMFGFTLLGTGALMAGGDRRRRRNNES